MDGGYEVEGSIGSSHLLYAKSMDIIILKHRIHFVPYAFSTYGKLDHGVIFAQVLVLHMVETFPIRFQRAPEKNKSLLNLDEE